MKFRPRSAISFGASGPPIARCIGNLEFQTAMGPREQIKQCVTINLMKVSTREADLAFPSSLRGVILSCKGLPGQRRVNCYGPVALSDSQCVAAIRSGPQALALPRRALSCFGSVAPSDPMIRGLLQGMALFCKGAHFCSDPRIAWGHRAEAIQSPPWQFKRLRATTNRCDVLRIAWGQWAVAIRSPILATSEGTHTVARLHRPAWSFDRV